MMGYVPTFQNHLHVTVQKDGRGQDVNTVSDATRHSNAVYGYAQLRNKFKKKRKIKITDSVCLLAICVYVELIMVYVSTL